MTDHKIGEMKVSSFSHPKTGNLIWYVARYLGNIELLPGYTSETWETVEGNFPTKAAATKWMKKNNK